MLKKSSRPAAAGGAVELSDPEFAGSYPGLWAYLTQAKWEDGSPRQLATLGVYPDRGLIRVMLRDPNHGVILWCAVTTFTDLWAALESLLNDPRADWRTDRRSSGDVATRREAPPQPGEKRVDRGRSRR